MQKSFKSSSLRWLGVLLLASTLFIACNNEEKKVDTPVEVKKDSLPPIDNDSLIKGKPETIINKPAS